MLTFTETKRQWDMLAETQTEMLEGVLAHNQFVRAGVEPASRRDCGRNAACISAGEKHTQRAAIW
jgi:hypothetical protein